MIYARPFAVLTVPNFFDHMQLQATLVRHRPLALYLAAPIDTRLHPEALYDLIIDSRHDPFLHEHALLADKRL